MYSPAAMDGAAPSTVTRSRCPRALMRRTQKPLSALWKVTRSTKPAKGSRSLDEPDPAVSIQTCLSRRRAWRRSHLAAMPWRGNPQLFSETPFIPLIDHSNCAMDSYPTVYNSQELTPGDPIPRSKLARLSVFNSDSGSTHTSLLIEASADGCRSTNQDDI